MSDNIIDTVIDAAEQAPVDAPKEDTSEQAEGQEAPQTQEGADADDNTPFPKKAVNAIARRDKQLGKLRAEHAQMMAELRHFKNASMQQQQSTNSGNGSNPPSEDDYNTYGEYIKALAKYEVTQSLSKGNESNQKQQPQQPQYSQQEVQDYIWTSQREQAISEQANALMDSSPEYKQLLESNMDILDSMPPAIERAFLEADNAALAFVTLAREGRLEELLTMSPARAAIEIGKAEHRGDSYQKAQKQVTKAPAPMQAAKGTSGGAKSLDDMSADELRAWYKS